MPLVFVHGVNVREGAAYQKEVFQRNRYLSNIFLKLLGRNLEPESIFCPYWGDLATSVSPGNPFLPSFDTPLSTTKKVLNHLAHGAGAKNSKLSLLRLARQQPIEDVVDLMVAAAAENEPAATSAEAEQLSDFAYSALKFSKQFSNLDEQLLWLEGINTDAQFLGKLEQEIERSDKRAADRGSGDATKGMSRVRRAVSWMQNHWVETHNTLKSDIGTVRQRALEHAKEDIARIRSTARNAVKTIAAARRRTTTHLTAAAITHPLRKIVHNRLFLFIGDAFLYFGNRGTPEAPGPIVSRIIDTIDSASTKIDPDDDPELIVIAHSMGGNIACDVLSYFAPDKAIDLVITVGAQFPLFADLHMFPGLDTRHRPIARPPNVKRWINIYDVNDVFGFAATPMFDGIEDVEFTSGRFGVATHADCFKFVSLYERMAQAVLQPARK